MDAISPFAASPSSFCRGESETGFFRPERMNHMFRSTISTIRSFMFAGLVNFASVLFFLTLTVIPRDSREPPSFVDITMLQTMPLRFPLARSECSNISLTGGLVVPAPAGIPLMSSPNAIPNTILFITITFFHKTTERHRLPKTSLWSIRSQAPSALIAQSLACRPESHLKHAVSVPGLRRGPHPSQGRPHQDLFENLF